MERLLFFFYSYLLFVNCDWNGLFSPFGTVDSLICVRHDHSSFFFFFWTEQNTIVWYAIFMDIFSKCHRYCFTIDQLISSYLICWKKVKKCLRWLLLCFRIFSNSQGFFYNHNIFQVFFGNVVGYNSFSPWEIVQTRLKTLGPLSKKIWTRIITLVI